MIEAAGFVDVRFSEERWNAFGGSPSETDAAKFGTEGVAIWARKPDETVDALGDGCATLTPRLRGHMRGLESGQILALRSDDPAALEGIPAWTRMTGNELVGMRREGELVRFSIRKK